MLFGLVSKFCPNCLQNTLFSKDGYTISLDSIATQDQLCQRLNQTANEKQCACTSDYYLLVIKDASPQSDVYASVVLPEGKPVGAGAIQKALLQSLESRALAMFVPPSRGLAQSYRWVLLVQPSNVKDTIRFGVL